MTKQTPSRALGMALCLLLPGNLAAQTVTLPGPEGPLQAERLGPAQADHAIVLIPGSGPTDRDGNSPMGIRSESYKLLGVALAEAGVITLRIDKRGMFGSVAAISDANAVTLAEYAQDARDWVALAAQDARCVWLAGHSEGGLVALLASPDAPAQLCGVILLTTPGRPAAQVLIEQMAANPANAPLLPELRAILTDLEAGRTRDVQSISAPLQPLFSAALQLYLIDLLAHDPARLAARYSGPVLIVSATADIQLSAADADALAKALPKAHRLTLEGGTHC